MTLFDLCADFLKRYAARRLRPTTARGYETNFRAHILPHLGGVKVAELTAEHLDDLTERMTAAGYASRTVVYTLATLRKALNYAVKRGYVAVNPFARFDMPRVEEFRYRTLTEAQIREAFEATTGGDPVGLAVRLALRYGMRRGEVLGVIPESDLDEGRHTLHIQRTRTVEHGAETVTPCKTKKSNRFVLLAADDVETLAHVRQGYAVPLTPTQIDKRFKAFLAAHGFPDMRFHDLRHSYATFMLAKGINPKIVSSVLGHSGVDVTLDIYSHPNVEMQKACLDAIL